MMMKRKMMTMRKIKIDYYLDVAKSVAQRSPCARRKVGAIIVKNDTIVGTGYNGSARGVYNCGTDIPCLKNLANEPHLTSYSYCSGVHAEDNAISAAGWERCDGATMFLYVQGDGATPPCFQCRRKILNSQLLGVWVIGDTGEKKYISNEALTHMEQEWQREALNKLGSKVAEAIMK